MRHRGRFGHGPHGEGHEHRHEHWRGRRHEGFEPGEDWGEEGRGPFGRHRGRRRVLDSNELRLVLLKLIAEAPRHGYELIQAVGDLTGGAYGPSPGVVYPALSMLEDMGLIAPTGEDGTRKAFAATEAGGKEIASNEAAIADLFARLGSLADMQARFDASPVKRAMQNLKSVLRTTLVREGDSKSRVHEVAAILDAAAQQIERLP